MIRRDRCKFVLLPISNRNLTSASSLASFPSPVSDMPVSHVSLATGASHFARMRSFYLTTLAPLGYVTYFDRADFMLGLKPVGKFPDFWLHVGNGEQTAFPASGDVETRPGRTHVAFDADSHETVDKWYAEAM
ncbi:hypothetical protein F4803DRAFT_496873 [Xylaria telfairii]|nr:hypothetical protein F4803DRAFT_496873 [Xylaria telfairii]